MGVHVSLGRFCAGPRKWVLDRVKSRVSVKEKEMQGPRRTFLITSLSSQHHLCLHDPGDHGDASHKHPWRGGPHVHCPGAGVVQRHVFRTRVSDAGTLHHHDPEGKKYLVIC